MPLDVNPYDGFRAEILKGATYRLVVTVTADGDAQGAHTLTEFPTTPEGCGQADLYEHVFVAICRFLSAGGSLEKLQRHLEQLSQQFAGYQVVFPPAWKLIAVLQDVRLPQQVWACDATGEAAVITEDESLENYALETVRNYVRQG